MSAVFGTVGLGEYAADLVACFNECLQRCHGEVGRTHKQNTHYSSSSISSSNSYSSAWSRSHCCSSSPSMRRSVRSTNR